MSGYGILAFIFAAIILGVWMHEFYIPVVREIRRQLRDDSSKEPDSVKVEEMKRDREQK